MSLLGPKTNEGIPMSSFIDLSNEERDSEVLSGAKIAAAASNLRENGFVIMNNAIPSEPLEILREKLDREFACFMGGKKPWMGGGRIIGHLGVHPLGYDELVTREILANPVLMSITSYVLEGPIYIEGVGGNTNAPSSVPQQFHSDVDDWSGKRLLINIPLSDVDERNGSLEAIPKSHRGDCRNRTIEELIRDIPPIRVNTRLGSAVIRFPNMIHRGTRNPSKKPRHMIVMWHSTSSRRAGNHGAATLDPRSESFLEAYRAMAEEGVEKRLHPVFYPNIFPVGMRGMVREYIFRHLPGAYRLSKKFLGRKKGSLSLGG